MSPDGAPGPQYFPAPAPSPRGGGASGFVLVIFGFLALPAGLAIGILGLMFAITESVRHIGVVVILVAIAHLPIGISMIVVGLRRIGRAGSAFVVRSGQPYGVGPTG